MRYYSYRITITRSINYLTVLTTDALVNLYTRNLQYVYPTEFITRDSSNVDLYGEEMTLVK